MLLGTKYAFNRKGAVQTVSKMLGKGAEMVAALDNSNKPIGERLESLCARLINEDDDVTMTIRRISTKFGIDVEMIVIPKFNDNTLLIDSYILAVPNSQNVLVPAIVQKDCEQMVDYLTMVALTRDEAVMKAFCEAIEKAVNTK